MTEAVIAVTGSIASDIIIFFSKPISRDTMLPTKVQWNSGFIDIKAVLGLCLAVNVTNGYGGPNLTTDQI